MATAVPITATRPIASPALSVAALLAANDTAACWTADPRARMLLASCVAVPPAGEWHVERYGNATDRWFAYVGYRAEALEAIRMEIGTALDLQYQQHGEAAYEPFRQWCSQPNATQAINAARSASMGG